MRQHSRPVANVSIARMKNIISVASTQGLGTQADGGFAEYVINHEARIHKLPEKVSLLQASLTEPLACCVHGAMETSQVKPGETVLIFWTRSYGTA